MTPTQQFIEANKNLDENAMYDNICKQEWCNDVHLLILIADILRIAKTAEDVQGIERQILTRLISAIDRRMRYLSSMN